MFVSHLACLRCGARYPMDPRAYLCPQCAAPEGDDPGILDVVYDAAAARFRPDGEEAGVFRYLAALPLREPRPVLPAGATPLIETPRIAKRLGLRAVYVKDETRNPTRCLKDRATAIAVSMALEAGALDVYCASAGNAAISLAGYAAHAGLRCHVFVPRKVSSVRLDWLRRYGAEIQISTGDYDQAVEESESAGRANGWYSRNCAYNPFLVEGKKTCGWEIAEGVEADLVIAPVGDGCTLAAIGKGLREAREAGVSNRAPRLIGVQASGIQPAVSRFHGRDALEPGETKAWSIAVRRPRNILRLLAELRASQGSMIAVDDAEIERAQQSLGAEAGIVAEFTSAATLAALESLAEREPLEAKTAVLVITGGRVD